MESPHDKARRRPGVVPRPREDCSEESYGQTLLTTAIARRFHQGTHWAPFGLTAEDLDRWYPVGSALGLSSTFGLTAAAGSEGRNSWISTSSKPDSTSREGLVRTCLSRGGLPERRWSRSKGGADSAVRNRAPPSPYLMFSAASSFLSANALCRASSCSRRLMHDTLSGLTSSNCLATSSGWP